MPILILSLTIMIGCFLLNCYLASSFNFEEYTFSKAYHTSFRSVFAEETEKFWYFILTLLFSAPLTIAMLVATLLGWLTGRLYKRPKNVRCAYNLGRNKRTIYALNGKIWVCVASSSYGEDFDRVKYRINKWYIKLPGGGLPNSLGNQYLRAVNLLENNDSAHFDSNGVLYSHLTIKRNYPLL